MNSKQHGFTLIEITMVLVALAILAAVFTPIYGSIGVSQGRAAVARNYMNSSKIADALNATAATIPGAVLPNPYTGAGYFRTVYNPADTSAVNLALIENLKKAQVPFGEVNSDGTAGESVRVYQLVSGLSKTMPWDYKSGPLITLNYQFAAIYMTECRKGTATCNPNAATGVPGDSAALTATNFSTWAPAGTDQDAVYINTLDVQTDMLETTKQKMLKLQDAFLSYFRTAQVTAAAGDGTNFYPAATSSMAGQNPAGVQQGCRDGWYSLTTSDILPKIGLTTAQYGTTAWNAPIEYCRDYDPTGTKSPDASPHFAALRIRSNLSLGAAPDSSIPNNNIVFTF